MTSGLRLVAAWIVWKMSSVARGMMPAAPGSPIIVYVLPDAVWPYAKTVAL